MYSIFYCMKSLFLERTQGLQLDCFGTNSKQSMISMKQVNESPSGATVHQEKNNKRSTRSSEGEECTTEKRGSPYSTATIDIEKAIIDIKRKCKKQVQKLVQEHEEKKVELVKMYADKKKQLETRKVVEAAVIRITCSGTSKVDVLKEQDQKYEKTFDEIKSEKDECLKSLERMFEAAKKKLAEDEACWICRVKNWAQAEVNICVPIKRGNNKHFSGICSSNTLKNAPDVLTSNDANLSKSASPEFSLDREEALVTIENNRTNHVDSDADNILAQQNKEACSLDKEIPDESALPMPHPAASEVETRGSTESDQVLTAPCKILDPLFI